MPSLLASSDYGYLARQVFDPRPNYFAVLLWNRLMGTEVFDSQIPIQEGAHVFVHSRKDQKDGKAILIINNSELEATSLKLESEAHIYRLSGKDGQKRADKITLNGETLSLREDGTLPELVGEVFSGSELIINPTECVFIII